MVAGEGIQPPQEIRPVVLLSTAGVLVVVVLVPLLFRPLFQEGRVVEAERMSLVKVLVLVRTVLLPLQGLPEPTGHLLLAAAAEEVEAELLAQTRQVPQAVRVEHVAAAEVGEDAELIPAAGALAG